MIVGYETCKSVLLDSGLLICEDDYFYKFGYKYVYYFTVAEYISGIVNQKEGKMIIQSLCNTIESEEVSNILIFLTYHIFQHLSPFGKGRKQTLAFRPSRPISGILGKWLNNFILLLSSINTFKCSILCWVSVALHYQYKNNAFILSLANLVNSPDIYKFWTNNIVTVPPKTLFFIVYVISLFLLQLCYQGSYILSHLDASRQWDIIFLDRVHNCCSMIYIL